MNMLFVEFEIKYQIIVVFGNNSVNINPYDTI